MKKWMMILLVCALLWGAACAETARDYALWLEEVLPGAEFADAAIPEFVTAALGADYEFIAREDATYGGYIAGVRRADAPALPDGARQSAYGGTFETRVFRAEDGAGNVLYEFVLADGVYMQAYDGLKHLVIWIDPNAESYSEFQKMFAGASSMIFNAANAQYRAQMAYAANHGFSPEDDSRCQMSFPVHNLESWQAGITDQPTHFYLDMTPPESLLGEKYLEEEALIQYTRIPIGVYLRGPETDCELVLSEDGVLGVETDAPHRLYQAGPGCEVLLDLAEEALGYRPGSLNFTGRKSVRAELVWQAGELVYSGESDERRSWQAGSIALENPDQLARLDALLSGADFTVGSVNCPSPCFLKLEYADGSCASMAVAVNSFDLFFHNGMYFTTQEDIIGLFNLENTDFYKGYHGG